MKFEIKNRLGLKLVIQVDELENATQLVFIAHGLKGSKDLPHIKAFARAFRQAGYMVVRFDATHAAGESDGELFDVTFDTYVHDLEDVIEWARMQEQEWFVSPFALCGHSMGAQSTAWYAEQHPEEIELLAPMAPVVNYELYSATYDSQELKDYKEKGYRELVSSSQPEVIQRIGWACHESLKNYDILSQASELTMPVIDIVGSEDEPCPVSHQEMFMNHIPGNNKHLIVVQGMQHSYRNATTNKVDGGLDEVEKVLKDWLIAQHSGANE